MVGFFMRDEMATVVRFDDTSDVQDVNTHVRGWATWEGYSAWIAAYTGTPVDLSATSVDSFREFIDGE